jgi:hypothetical protein
LKTIEKKCSYYAAKTRELLKKRGRHWTLN